MSCLEVLPRNRKRSLWKMVRSLFFGQKTVSKVVNIRKKGIVKRRSTFERPPSTYTYPVVEKRTRVRQQSVSSDSEVESVPPSGAANGNNNRENSQNIEVQDTQFGGNRLGLVITLAHLEITPGLNTNDNEEIRAESEQFFDCNIPAVDQSTDTAADEIDNRQVTQSDISLQATEDILEMFDRTVKLNSRSNSNLNESRSNSGSSQGTPENSNEICISENIPVSTVCRRPGRSQSMAIGMNTSGETVLTDAERRKSYVEVTRVPPITLRYIPSGLKIEDRVVWVTESGPENGTVRWIGKIREQFFAGVELDKPIGNSSGLFGYGPGLFKRLFTCKLSYGRFIPVKELVLYSDYHDNGLKAGIICIICRDDFLETWEPSAESPGGSDSSKMVATKDCGHLFHAGCLKEWFSKKNYDNQPCPYCQHPMDRNDVIRIFPAQF